MVNMSFGTQIIHLRHNIGDYTVNGSVICVWYVSGMPSSGHMVAYCRCVSFKSPDNLCDHLFVCLSFCVHDISET